MDDGTIRELHEYNAWANDRLFSCASAISPEQFVDESDLPWGSIRNQLVHVLDVHRRWLNWADGTMSGEEAYALSIDMADCPDLQSVCAWWDQIHAQTKRFLDRMTDDDLRRDLKVSGDGYSFSIPVGKVMIQIAFHGMQHRAETALELTRLGHSPGDIDYIFYALR